MSHRFTAEERASMFMDWCALKGFGLEGWPPDAHAELTAVIRKAERAAVEPAREGRDTARDTPGGEV